MSLRTRPFDEPDSDAVVALWSACGLTRPWNDPVQDIARKLQVQREWFLVAEQGGVIVASVMAGYDGHRGSVYYLAVQPSMQGQGIGRRLMHEVEAALLRVGCAKVNLLVRGSNTAVLGFYQALGYAVDDVVGLGHRLIEDRPPDEPHSTNT